MVKPEDLWRFKRHSAHPSLNFNCTSTPLHQGQQNVSPFSVKYPTFSPGVAFPGFRVPSSHGPAQTNGAHGLIQFLPPHLDVKEGPSALYYGHGVKATQNSISGSRQKRFVVFDQSGDQTRLFFGPLCSPAQNPIVTTRKSLAACDLRVEGKAVDNEKFFLTKASIQEKSEENEIVGERSEMHEDTDEINALLYSDDDDDGYDSDEEDEVTSTDRSPCAIKACYKKREHEEEITAELANPERPMKRQRLIDGGYTRSFAKLEAEPNCAEGRNPGAGSDSISGNKQSRKDKRKDKIRKTLKILESLIPGVNSEDPLLVIDEAISYLKYLKVKAKASGVS